MKIDVVAWRAGFEPDINGDFTRTTPFSLIQKKN
jgi:hypothetical protein